MIQKRIELDRYIIHSAVTVQDKKQTPKPKNKQTRQKHQKANNTKQTKNKNQHGQLISSWTIGMHEEMITLYHLRDWYSNVKQKRNNKPQSAIQQSVRQEATNAQCGNQGSPQPEAPRSQSASRTGNMLTDSWIRSKSQKDAVLSQGETRCESGAKVKRQKLTALRARVLSRVLCRHQT